MAGTNGDGVFPPPSIVTTVFVTIAFYNVFELVIIALSTIRPLCGLYFYSFIGSAIGIAIYLLGIVLKTYHLSNEILVFSTFLILGWIPMVTGQALLLYSRLKYLVPQPKVVKGVFIMIVVSGTICHVPIVAMVYGAASAKSVPWALALINYEKVQVTLFFLQMLVISGLYTWHSIRILRNETKDGEEARIIGYILHKLICLSVLWLLVEMTIIIFEWRTPITVSAVYKATAYSVILKLEYNILNRISHVLPCPALPSRPSDLDLEKAHAHDSASYQFAASAHESPPAPEHEPTTIQLHTFNGKTQIISTAQFNAESDYPANEAYRSSLNDEIMPVVQTKCRRSVIQHWADAIDTSTVDDEDDLDSFCVKSRRAMSDVGFGGGAGLSPGPVFRKGSI